jgi:DNA-binding response OmpR family regulator
MARILIIEDSAHQRTALKNLLIRQGHEPILAEDGAGGLKLIADVDLVLCDVFMPVLDGFEFLEALLDLDEPAPTVMVSADLTDADRLRWLELGALGILEKPVSGESLTALLEEHLSDEQRGGGAPQHHELFSTSPMPPAPGTM